MNDLIKQDWYEQLIEDCKDIIVESTFTSRWALIEGYWQLGKRIRDDDHFEEFQQSNLYTLQDLANTIGISERTIYYALQAYDKYPDIQQIPEGKKISWNKLITEYLTRPKENLIEIPTPKGKYNTIIIDPPWPMEFMQLENRPNQVEMPYPVMTLDQIGLLPVSELAHGDCNLFLWTTHKFLPNAFTLLEQWGFGYHVCLTWDKTNGRALFGFNRQTEFCLYAHNGKITVNQRGSFIPTVFTEKLREHSRKPDVFYDLLRSNSPEPRLDMFSREKRDGFDSWGNEINKWEKTNGNLT